MQTASYPCKSESRTHAGVSPVPMLQAHLGLHATIGCTFAGISGYRVGNGPERSGGGGRRGGWEITSSSEGVFCKAVTCLKKARLSHVRAEGARGEVAVVSCTTVNPLTTHPLSVIIIITIFIVCTS